MHRKAKIEKGVQRKYKGGKRIVISNKLNSPLSHENCSSFENTSFTKMESYPSLNILKINNSWADN